MASCQLLPLLLLIPILVSALTVKEKKLIVQKHNYYRSRTEPPAANMKALSWDTTLEELATSYAAKCIWEHNEERGFRGENLFLMSGSGLDVHMGLADWHNEQNFYNFTDNTCQEGQMCGHYTQMVWAGTQRVGCGEKFCETIVGFEEKNMYLLVCNYEPPGNFQGQKPFTVGPPCSECLETDSCQGSLCVDVDLQEKEDSTDLPDTTSELAPDTASQLAPYTVELAPYTVELAPYTVELAPDKLLEITSYATTVAEDDITTALSIPTKSPAVPTTISEQIPDSPHDSSFGYPQTPQDISPQIALATSDDIDSLMSTQHTSVDQSTDVSEGSTQREKDNEGQESHLHDDKDPQHTSTQNSGKYAASPKMERILESTVPPTSERPSSPLQTTSVQTFSNDGPNTVEEDPLDKIRNVKKLLHEDLSELMDKDQPKDSPLQPTSKTLQLLVSQTKEKDMKTPSSDPRTAKVLNTVKEKSNQKSKFTFVSKKDQLKPNYFFKGVKWSFTSEQLYFGKQMYGPPFGPQRSLCPYPCLTSQPPSKFPLYRPNIASPWGGQNLKDRQAGKPRPKKPCKLSGYKRGVYNLYLPSKNIEENLTNSK